MPRAAMSVATRMSYLPSRKPLIALWRWFCDMLPCNADARYLRFVKSRARLRARYFVRVNISTRPVGVCDNRVSKRFFLRLLGTG